MKNEKFSFSSYALKPFHLFVFKGTEENQHENKRKILLNEEMS